MAKLSITQTGDGSPTLFDEERQEIYHSRHGAWEESKHVFIKMGLEAALAEFSSLRILEIGLGTGLNASLTLAYHENKPIPTEYWGIEPLRIPPNLYQSLDYSGFSEHPEWSRLFSQVHEAEWEKDVSLKPDFTLHKVEQNFQDWQSPQSFHLIYFDAFAPTKQSEMWEKGIFEKIASLCEPEAILVTYCAQGQFRRNLEAAGFKAERLPGPPGKREMIRGRKLA